MNKDRRHGQRGQAIVEYVALLGFITLGLIVVFPKYGSANQNAFLCASGGMSNPVACTNGVADPSMAAEANGTTSTATTSTSTTDTTASPVPGTTSATATCHYDNGYGNAGYNQGVVCTNTGNSNTRFGH